jgi:hypothetical protein
MPISTSSFGDERDNRYAEYTAADDYEEESIDFLGLSPEQAETILKRLGGGVEEKLRRVEGIGWIGTISPTDGGVQITFKAHDELLDDLVRRFESWADRELGA